MIEAPAQNRERQVAHWRAAVDRLRNLEGLAAPQAWRSLEMYLGTAIRRALGDAVARLDRHLAAAAANPGPGPGGGFDEFREHYLRVESVIDFYVDALNTRSTPYMGALLRTCDWLASLSMSRALVPLGIPRPPVLVYADRGLGAAILKAGLRLWDRKTDNPAAVIRVTFHNVLRPTALVHEAGHQVAHLIGWNEELRSVLESSLPASIAGSWGSWASEIAADAYAFANCGYASVLALHDVLDSGADGVHHLAPAGPHPPAYLRLLLATAMCEVVFGSGLWGRLAADWDARYGRTLPGEVEALVRASRPELARIASLSLRTPLACFGGRSPADALQPQRVSPGALWQLESGAGNALLTSPHWAAQEGLRIVALSGYRIGAEPGRTAEFLRSQEAWMLRVGATWLGGLQQETPG